MCTPDDQPELAVLYETHSPQEAALLQARLADASIRSFVDNATSEHAVKAPGGEPAPLAVLIETGRDDAARAILRRFCDDLKADEEEPVEGRSAYQTWAIRNALRFALAAFLVALGLGALLRLVAVLFR